MNIYDFIRGEIGEDSIEVDMVIDELLDEYDMDETDFNF